MQHRYTSIRIMKIVIDTNIIRQDLLFKSSDYNIILDYLLKTDSNVLLPQIVFEEISSVYKRHLEDRLQDLTKANRILNTSIVDKSKHNEIKEIDIKNEVKEYLNYVLKKFSLKKKDIYKYKPEYLSEIVKRATKRIKPCSESGQQFRDTLLWLTLIDIAKDCDNNQLVFISNNTKDFGDNSKTKLHPRLLDDTSKAGVNIYFFPTIQDFIKEHASKIDYITSEWLESIFDLNKIGDQVIEILENDGISSIESMLKDHEIELTGYINLTGYCRLWVEDFYIYEMTNGVLSVELRLYGEFEVEYEFEKEVEKEVEDWDYEYSYNALKDDFDFEPVLKTKLRLRRSTIIDTKELELSVDLSVKIKDKKLLGYDIKNWELQ